MEAAGIESPTSETHSPWIHRGLAGLLVLLFSAASMLAVHQYRLGVGDHWTTLPIVKSCIDRELYRNDYAQIAMPYYYTLLWPGVAWIVAHLAVPMAPLFFAAQWLCVALSFAGIYLNSGALFNDRRVAYLAMFFFLCVTESPFAGGCTLEGIFTTRSVALPILLFALYFFLRQRYLASYALQGAALLIHPLTAVYLVTMLAGAVLANIKSFKAKRLLLCGAVLLATASPILIWKVLHPPPSTSVFRADATWLEAMRLRSSDAVFPFSWSFDDYFRFLLLVYVFVLSWKHRPESRLHTVVLGCGAGVLAMFILGTVFSELIPAPLFMQLQLFRSSVFLLILVIVYVANFLLVELASDEPLFSKAAAAFASVGVFYKGLAESWQFCTVGFLALTVWLIIRRSVRGKAITPSSVVLAIVVLLCAVASIALLQRGSLPKIGDVTERQWTDVQIWAKRNTDRNAVFIVPPFCPGFRNQSERSIYGDWKDGTMGFWSVPFAREWLHRMERLGFDKQKPDQYNVIRNYKLLTPSQFMRIANEMGDAVVNVYVVVTTDHPRLSFRQVYSNEYYRVHQLRGGPDS